MSTENKLSSIFDEKSINKRLHTGYNENGILRGAVAYCWCGRPIMGPGGIKKKICYDEECEICNKMDYEYKKKHGCYTCVLRNAPEAHFGH